MNRNEIRAAALKTMQLKREEITFNGVRMELIQPLLTQVTALHEVPKNEHFARSLIEYACVPGTDEKVFEAADLDALKTIPYSPDVLHAQEAINRLMFGDGIKEATKNSEGTISATT